MERAGKSVVGVVIVVALMALALPLWNLVVGKPSGTARGARAADPMVGPVATLLEGECGHCHIPGTERPFYARIPPASSVIAEDVRGGLDAMDLVDALFPASGGAPAEPVLAKIEFEIAHGEMPPLRYLALHWGAILSADQKDTILAWVRNVRAKTYAPATLAPALRTAVIRPIPTKADVDPRAVALGAKLYHDPRLSGDGTIACATCHDLAKGGTDQARVSTGIRGQEGGINAPTTFNSGFQFMQFWDGRAATLEEQAAGPPANPIEMGATWPGIEKKLAADTALAGEITAIYPDGVSTKNITAAIAAFERTLITPGSRFDEFLLGGAAAMTAEQKHGYELFLSHGCATCHVGELLGGQSFERMGRTGDYFGDRGEKLADADNGRYNVTKREADRHKFKVPTLRNVARTAPYFHDGTQPDLRSAVVAMTRYQLGIVLPEGDVAAIVQFLEALTGEYQGKPL